MINRRELLTSLAFCVTPRLAAYGSGDAAAEPILIDVGRQLFVDDLLVEETTLERTFHTPRIHSGSPILKPETPLEMNHGVMPAAAPFSDGVWYDSQDQLYKMWYLAGYDDGFAYVTSKDGICWIRPNLDIIPRTNRVLASIPGYERNGSTVWLDHDAQDPSERFKMFAYFRAGTGSWPRKLPVPPPKPLHMGLLFTSPDGIHWKMRARTGPCGDNTGIFYNPFRKVWTYSIRSSDHVHGRTRSYCECPDFIGSASWGPNDVKFWLACDDRDRPDPALGYRPQLYKVDCMAYESRMLGLFAIFYGPPNPIAYREKIPKTIDLQVGFSHDGLKWERPARTAFLACSRRPGTWNRGYLHSAGGLCLVVGDELRFYFTAFSGISPARGGGTYAGASTGLALLRRDGFASLGGSGSVTTRRIRFNGQYLFVNVNGSLRAEILDEWDRAIPEFSKENCMRIEANHTKIPVVWKHAGDVGQLAGRPVRFRFYLETGELYAFWVSPDRSGASHGYVAGGGPGFKGSRDTTGA